MECERERAERNWKDLSLVRMLWQLDRDRLQTVAGWQHPCSQASKDLLFRSCFLSCSLKEKSVGGGWWLLWRRRRQRQRQRRHVWDKKWASEWMGIRDERPTNNCSKDRFAWIKSLDWSVWKLLKGRPVGLYTIVSLNGRFQYQRSAVWIQSRAKILYWTFVYCQLCYWKDENKGKEAGDGPFLKKKVYQSNTRIWSIMLLRVN